MKNNSFDDMDYEFDSEVPKTKQNKKDPNYDEYKI